jgi:hypothetical protein
MIPDLCVTCEASRRALFRPEHRLRLDFPRLYFNSFAVFPRHLGMRFPHGLTYYYYTLSRLFSGYILYFSCLSFRALSFFLFFVFYHKYKSAESLLPAFVADFFASVFRTWKNRHPGG